MSPAGPVPCFPQRSGKRKTNRRDSGLSRQASRKTSCVVASRSIWRRTGPARPSRNRGPIPFQGPRRRGPGNSRRPPAPRVRRRRTAPHRRRQLVGELLHRLAHGLRIEIAALHNLEAELFQCGGHVGSVVGGFFQRRGVEIGELPITSATRRSASAGGRPKANNRMARAARNIGLTDVDDVVVGRRLVATAMRTWNRSAPR